MTREHQVESFVRAYSEPPNFKPLASKPKRTSLDAPSEYTLILDCETTVSPDQRLRFGFFQVRRHDDMIAEGIFFDPTALSASEQALLHDYAAEQSLRIYPIEQFRTDVFLRLGYKARAAIVGFNLPFDLSRIALDWTEARGSLRGGFSFKLTVSPYDPPVRIKHLSSTTALMDFAKPAKQDTPRGMRKRGEDVPPHRGYFYDVHTLAAALLDEKGSLGRLAKHLGTPTQKHEGVSLDGPVTRAQIAYARADVQVTWECFVRLRNLYASYGLSKPLHRVQSSASIGKACLDDMGILPLLACRPDTSRDEFGMIMSSYFGGRAEIRIRRKVTQVVLTDFKSMYPSVNALMGLWRFITADGYTREDTTVATQELLNSIDLIALRKPEAWRQLTTLVRLCPVKAVLPLRTGYHTIEEDSDPSERSCPKALNIGLNYVSSGIPLWYTLADVIASKLLTGRTPVILEAISYKPGEPQAELKPVRLLGKAEYEVNPISGDGFKRLVVMRGSVPEHDPARSVIKTINNSASYGISVEVNRDDAPKPEDLLVYGPDYCFQTSSCAIEEPGKYFNPLLATFITGAARLMLAITERIAAYHGLGWAFCDTDSMALAKPDGLDCDTFFRRAQSVVNFFVPLNPFEEGKSILKIEDVNRDAIGLLEPLYVYAISAKRYALFNLDDNERPSIRKFSAHGLGHLMDPYPESDPAPGVPPPYKDVGKMGGKRWQYDLWYHILLAALDGKPHAVKRDHHPALSKVALMRYGATSPALLRWMKRFNEGKPYSAQVKPFGFLVAFSAKGQAFEQGFEAIAEGGRERGRPPKARVAKPIAPFERDPAIAVSKAFDRENGEPVPASVLQTYAEALRGYHRSAEDKFENGGPADVGRTERRHLRVVGIRLIGKEANRIDEIGAPDPISPACVEFDMQQQKPAA